MEGRGRSRARKKAKFFSPKRLTSFLLAAAMVCTNIGSDLSTAYAAGTSSEVTFEMRGADLTAAVEEAIVSENVVTPDDLNFTNGKVDDFKGYLFGEGKLYEAYPEMEGGDVEADMRVFVRLPEDADDMYAVTGDEEVIFLYINNSDETVRFRSRINYMVDGEEKVKQTDSVTVRSYESIFGDEEVNVISDPVEEIPETTVPETEEVPETPAEDPVATESEMTVSMSPNAAALVSAPGEEATPSEWPEDETDAEVPETMAPEEETAVPAEEDPAAEETTEAAETIPVATPSETPAATDSEIENAPKPSYSDIVGIGWSGTAKVYASTLNKLHALDDVEGWKVEYSITPEGSARIVDGARGVEDGEDLYFGVKNQIGYAVETVLANGEELTADTITDNEDGSQTAWYAVYGVTEEQSIDVVMAETGEHPAFEQTLAMDDGMQISIKAEAGVLPVGVEATAERVSQEVEAAVVESASAEGKTLTSVYAYDINLWLNGQLLDSEIWGGSKRVQVTFSGDPVKEASEQASAVEVLHVETVQDTDQEAKEKAAVQEEEIKAEDVLGIETVSEVVEVPAEESVDAVSFEAEHFTVYAVAARASEVSFGDFEMMLGETVTVNSDADSSSYNHKWSVAQSDIISVKGDGRSATVTALNLGEVTLTHEYYTGFLNRHEEQATVKVVSNEGMVKVEWYINGEVVETDWVNEGERPTYDGTQPNRQIRFSDGSSANMKFKGWATEPNSKNFSDVEDLPGVTEDTKYYAIFSYDALFYFVLEGKSNTSTNANDYMFAGPDYSNDTAVYGEVIIPDGFGGASRWYVGSQLSTDIDSYIIDGTTDAAIRKGLDQAYDDYDSRWEYTIDWTTLSFAGSSVGYYKDWNGNYITISSQQVLHVDGAVILDKETTAGIQYVVTNPDREVVTASKTHNKGEAVEINSTVRDSGNFTTDGETYEATQWYGGELYRFDGWYEDFNYTTKAPETITVTKRQTFYARYVKVDTYRVYYDWGNPPEVVTDEYVLPVDRNVYEEGDTYQVDQGDFAPVLEYDAYGNVDGRWTFSGWTDPNNGVMGEADVTVTGEWDYEAVEVATHKVSYSWTDAPDGEYAKELPSEITGLVKSEPYAIDTVYHEGYTVDHLDAYGNVDGRWTFSGWTDPNNGVMGEADVTVTGEWDYEYVNVEAHMVKYSWTNEPTGDYEQDLPNTQGGLVKNQPYTIDDGYYEGYTVDHLDAYGNVDGRWTFSGWTDPNNGVMGEADVTVTGEWDYEAVEVATHKVSYSWTDAPDGEYAKELPSEITGLVKSEPYAIDTVYHEGYTVDHLDAYGNVDGRWTFSGWTDPNNGVMGEADVTVTGEWDYEAVEVATHKVSYSWTDAPDGEYAKELPSEITGLVKSEPYAIDTVYHEGYTVDHLDAYGNVDGRWTFSGWTDPNNGVMGEADVTVTGEWDYEAVEVATHKVSYSWTDAPDGEYAKELPSEITGLVKSEPYAIDTVYHEGYTVDHFDAYGNVDGRWTFSGWTDPNNGVMGEADVTVTGEWDYEYVNVEAHMVKYSWTNEPTGDYEQDLPNTQGGLVKNQPYTIDDGYYEGYTVDHLDAYGNVDGRWTFSGWTDPNNGVMGEADVTVTGEWDYEAVEVATHKVSYSWTDAPDGEYAKELPSEITGLVKSEPYAIDTVYHEGYTVDHLDAYGNVDGRWTFSGWTDPNNGVMGEADVTVTGEWDYEAVEVATHKVSYSWTDAPDGEYAKELPSEITGLVKSEPYAIDTVYHEGYTVDHLDAYGNVDGRWTFSGWTDPNNGVMGEADVTVTGEWDYEAVEVATHKVSYSWTDAPDGEYAKELPSEITGLVKSEPYAIDTVYHEGYTVDHFDAYGNVDGRWTFSGWTDPNNGVMGEADVTVTGEWDYEYVNVEAHMVKYSWTNEPTGDYEQDLPNTQGGLVKNQPYTIDDGYYEGYTVDHLDAYGNVDGRWTFSGWTDPNNGVMGEADVTVTGEWDYEAVEVATHKVSYSWTDAPDGEYAKELPSEITGLVKSEPYAIDTVYHEGYTVDHLDAYGNVDGRWTFSGWTDPNNGVMGEADVTVTGEWDYEAVEVATHKVSYSWTDAPDGEYAKELPSEITGLVKSEPYAIDTVYHEGYTVDHLDAYGNVDGRWTFSGWTDPNNGVMGEADVTVTGEWDYEAVEVATHKVSYSWTDAPDGEYAKELPSEITGLVKSEPYAIDTVYHEGYTVDHFDAYGNVDGRWTFSGWTDPNNGVMGEADVTVTGEWDYEAVEVATHKVSYSWTDAPDGEYAKELPSEITGLVKSEPYAIDTVYHEGYTVDHLDAYGNVDGRWTFSGWTDPNNGVMGEADVTVTGEWDYEAVEVATHKVSYSWTDAPDGEYAKELPSEITGLVKSEPYAIDTVYHEGYTVDHLDAYGNVDGRWTFSGWTDPNNGVMGEADVTVTGEWDYEAVEVATHKVSYSWTDAPDGEYAKELPSEITGLVKSEPYAIDTVYHEGYTVDHLDAYGNVDGRWTFSGWTDPNNGVMGEADVTVTGEWDYEYVNVEAHMVKYSWTNEPTGDYEQDLPNTQGGLVKNQPYTIDDGYYEGYTVDHLDAYGNVDGRWTFSGWTDPNNGVMGEADVTVTGEWDYEAVEVATHKVSYSWTDAPDGEYAKELPSEITGLVKSEPYAIDTVYHEGYTVDHFDAYGNVDGRWTFSGWTDPNNGVMGEADVTVTGSWSYEVLVTYRVVNGSWDSADSGNTKDIQRWVLLTDGQYILTENDIPVAYPNTGYRNGVWYPIPQEAIITKTSNKLFVISFERDVYEARVEFYFENVDDILVEKSEEDYGRPFIIVPEESLIYNDHQYALDKIEGNGVIITEDPDQNVIKVYYGLDEIGGKDPENPNTPDGVPDKYQTTVMFAAVNGTVDGKTQAEKVVTLTDADGKPSETGSYILTEEDIPEAVAATGYSQDSKTWDVEPVGAEIKAEGTKNTFTVTFYPADQTFTVQYIDEDTNEGLKEQDVFNAKYGTYVDGEAFARPFEGYTFTRATELWVTEDNQINYVFVYYSKDVIGGGEDPNTPDEVPDKYQTFVVFAAVNGTVDGETQVEKVVTLTDADGKWSADGSYTLKEEDIPEAVAAVGYDQATATWDSENPASPVGSVIDNGEDTKVTFTVTFSPADQTYIVQYIDEDTNEGLKEQDVYNAKYGDYINGADLAIDFEGYTFTRATELWVTEDNQINYVFVYYSKDVIGGGEDPNTPDEVPDKYQTFVVFAAVNGTVDGETQVEKVVTLTDADGKPSETGSYTLKEEDIPEAVAAVGYDQATATWDSENPASPVGSVIDNGEDTKVAFTVTFSPADQTYIVQYIDEDTNEGLKEQDVFNAKYGDYINGADLAIDFEGYTFTRATELWVTEDNQINYVFVYYSKDVIGKDDPNTPDGVPDKYQAFVVFAAVNGTVDGETQVEKVVTLTDADGKPSETGSYTLKEEDIPEAVAAVGYDQATATWDSENPASPVGSVIDNGEDTKVTFTVTFSPADQTYIVQYIDEDTNEGLKEQDVFNAKYGDYINGADHAIEFEGYTFTRATELWVTEDNQINYVFVYYSKDEVGPEGPDDVPDKYQLVFTYVSADPATGTVTGKTVEVKTFKDEAGNYTEVKPTSPNTMDGHNPVPTAADGYAFAYWTEEGKDERDYTFNMTYTLGQKEYTENTTFVAHFLKDEGGKEDPNQPDGKPDEYQIKFTYVTEDPAHGTFAGVNEVSEILDRPTNIDGSPNMEAGVSPTVSVTITENGRYRFDHWTDAAGTEYTTEELRNATFTADATFTAHFRYISSSGGNGGGSGSSGGTGPYTPSTGGPGAAIIGDNDVPLAPLPTENNGGNIVIFDDSVPLAPLPKTGQQSSKAPVTMLLTGIFLMFASLKRRKEEKQ